MGDVIKMNEVKLQVTIKDAGLCPRYQAVVMGLPAKLGQRYLDPMMVEIAKAGMRAIDPIVDVTNYLMLVSGQPLHAFDYDKLVKVGGQDTAHIIVRAARDGETMTLLDGKEIAMGEGDIVITSNDVPVALAGAMGGANTAIDENTRRIVVESATFNLYNLRGTQFRHGIFSEAITRFTKGQPVGLTDFVIREFMAMTAEKYGLKVISEVVDAYPKAVRASVVKITTEQVNGLLGTGFGFDEIATTLENVGFKVKLVGETLNVTAPWWRTDIHIAEDVIEEVGRLNGYDEIPTQLPERNYRSVTPDAMGNLKSKIRQILAAAGANEVLTYSFVSGGLIEKANQDPKGAYKIINSISPELQYVRPSLTPSLLEKIYENYRAGERDFALFELNSVYNKGAMSEDEPDLPADFHQLGLVVNSKNDKEDAFYLAKRYLTELLERLGYKSTMRPFRIGETEKDKRRLERAIYRPFEPKRSAEVYVGEQWVANVGEYKADVLKNFKLATPVAGFELNLDHLLFDTEKPEIARRQLPKYQDVERDITFRVSGELVFAKLEELVRKTLVAGGLWFEIEPVSIYQGKNPQAKNISFRLTFANYEKTMTGAEIASIMDEIAAVAKKELKAEVI
ncbi:MAG: phenylalanine--tRNA ligase subunit beta [Candidatus Nomurabacteria bacterium]|jgi:phenylalanyl-tRNA synthetase beta chain|nr:phenylalanine--tRNA ligase subunit beta [Candidatus Nomurabacteria bacterium]